MCIFHKKQQNNSNMNSKTGQQAIKDKRSIEAIKDTMKRTLVVLSILFHITAMGQRQGFMEIIELDSRTLLGHAIETEDGGFVISAFGEQESYSLIKMDENGNLLDVVTNIGSGYIHRLIKDPSEQGLYHGLGIRDDPEYAVFIVHFDQDLNVLGVSEPDISIHVPESGWPFDPSFVTDGTGKVYFSICTSSYTKTAYTFARFTLDGVVEQCKTEFISRWWQFGLVMHPEGSCWGFLDGELYQLDDSLNMNYKGYFNKLEEQPLEGGGKRIVFLYPNAPRVVALPDTTFLVADRMDEIYYSQYGNFIRSDESFGMFKGDYELNVLGVTVSGTCDTVEEAARGIAIDYIDPEEIFLCGYQSTEPDTWGDAVLNNAIILKKTDSQLNVAWERYLRLGTGHYVPTACKATSDGGCLILGSFSDTGDFLDGALDSDGFVLKVNGEGMISVPENDLSVRPYAYWPNPAKDELHLHYSPDVKPTQIELYDLQGRLVCTQRNALESFTLQGLSPGTYTMRVALEDGTVFTDKVVKE